MEEIVYDGALATKIRIVNEHSGGQLKVICPKCNETVIVVLTVEDVIKYKKGLGLYCPNNHFWVHLERR